MAQKKKKKATRRTSGHEPAATHEHDHASCHDEGPPRERGPELPDPNLPRKKLAGRGKTVSVVVDASGAGKGHRYVRADIELLGLDHSGPSYEGRVFVNNKRANAKTPTDTKNGFAGRYHVFGHGQCFGDEGHCEIPKRRPEDHRSPHKLEPIVERLTVTEAIRHAAAKSTKVSITIVPVLKAATIGCDLDDVVRFERLRLVTYNA